MKNQQSLFPFLSLFLLTSCGVVNPSENGDGYSPDEVVVWIRGDVYPDRAVFEVHYTADNLLTFNGEHTKLSDGEKSCFNGQCIAEEDRDVPGYYSLSLTNDYSTDGEFTITTNTKSISNVKNSISFEQVDQIMYPQSGDEFYLSDTEVEFAFVGIDNDKSKHLHYEGCGVEGQRFVNPDSVNRTFSFDTFSYFFENSTENECEVSFSVRTLHVAEVNPVFADGVFSVSVYSNPVVLKVKKQ